MTAPTLPPEPADESTLPPDLRGMSEAEEVVYRELPANMQTGLLKEIERQIILLHLNKSQFTPLPELRLKLRRALLLNEPLRVKLGIDPSRPDLHLGHAVVLNKIADFQELGHKAVLIIGDFTASIGDPSGRSAERPVLSLAETRAHAQTYLDQAGILINMAGAEVRHNSEWLGALGFADVLKLARTTTVAQMLARDDFAKRFADERPVSIMEFLYPLAQGYDSVQVKADVELGGTDQTFNLLLGREIQRAYGQEPQVYGVQPLLPGTDGVAKMSKSADNYVGLTDPPFEKYSKVMSIPDSALMTYYRLLLKLTGDHMDMLEEQMAEGFLNPKDVKQDLARALVTRYHGLCVAADMEEQWERQFSRRETPEEIPEFTIPESLRVPETPSKAKLAAVMADGGMCESRSEARRLIKQGAVKVDGTKVTDPEYALDFTQAKLIQAGSRRYLRAQFA